MNINNRKREGDGGGGGDDDGGGDGGGGGCSSGSSSSSSSSATTTAKFITEIRESDVLCGVAAASGDAVRRHCNHPGNVQLRKILLPYAKAYRDAAATRNTARQDEIIKRILDTLFQGCGGRRRFLRPVEPRSTEAAELGVPPKTMSAVWVPMSPEMVMQMVQQELGKKRDDDCDESTKLSETLNQGRVKKEDKMETGKCSMGKRVQQGGKMMELASSSSSPPPSSLPGNASVLSNVQHPGAQASRQMVTATMPRRPITKTATVTPATAWKAECAYRPDSATAPLRTCTFDESEIEDGEVVRPKEQSMDAADPKSPNLAPSLDRRLRLIDGSHDNYNIYQTRLFGSKKGRAVPFRYQSCQLPMGLEHIFPGYKVCVRVSGFVAKASDAEKAGLAAGDVLCWIDKSQLPSSSLSRLVETTPNPCQQGPPGGRHGMMLLTEDDFNWHLCGWRKRRDCLVYVARKKPESLVTQPSDGPPKAKGQVVNECVVAAAETSSNEACRDVHASATGSTATRAAQRPIHDVERKAYETLTNGLVAENTLLRSTCQDLMIDIRALQASQRAVEHAMDELLDWLQGSDEISDANQCDPDCRTPATLSVRHLPDVIAAPTLGVNAWGKIDDYIENMMQQADELRQLQDALTLEKQQWKAAVANAIRERDLLQQEYGRLQAERVDLLNRFKRRRTTAMD